MSTAFVKGGGKGSGSGPQLELRRGQSDRAGMGKEKSSECRGLVNRSRRTMASGCLVTQMLWGSTKHQSYSTSVTAFMVWQGNGIAGSNDADGAGSHQLGSHGTH